MTELFENKYEEAGVDQSQLLYWEGLKDTRYNHRYGFVFVRNPHYLIDEDDMEYLIRKPTPKERREIIINTIVECNGRTFKIPKLAEMLAVSVRTVQTILRQLQDEQLIEVIPRFNKKGLQIGNAYRYIGPPCVKYGSGLTLQELHNPNINAGFRNWAWKEIVFAHNKVWHEEIYVACKAKFEIRQARREYLEENNLPLVVPEKIKYLVLRYCYWKGTYDKLYDDYLFSREGSLRFALFPLGRTETFTLFNHTFTIEFGGKEENPRITISDAKTNQKLGVFTWFDENIIECEKGIGKMRLEQYFILGDFTTK